jgi:hypothetical protein
MTNRIKSEYDFQALTVARLGGRFSLGDLSSETRNRLALLGLGMKLSSADDPVAVYDGIKSGEITVGREPKPETLDPWRDAAAHVHAEATIKGRGVKAPPGKRIRDASEFSAELALARAAAKGWTKAQLAEAKKHPDVVAEHGRITGKRKDLAALFAAPVADGVAAQGDAGSLDIAAE